MNSLLDSMGLQQASSAPILHSPQQVRRLASKRISVPIIDLAPATSMTQSSGSSSSGAGGGASTTASNGAPLAVPVLSPTSSRRKYSPRARSHSGRYLPASPSSVDNEFDVSFNEVCTTA